MFDPQTAIGTTVRMLRTVATWGGLVPPEELSALADAIEKEDPEGLAGWCCLVCEEVKCDEGCPLEFVRHPDRAGTFDSPTEGASS